MSGRSYNCKSCNKLFKTYMGFWKHNKKYHKEKKRINQNHTMLCVNIVMLNQRVDKEYGDMSKNVKKLIQIQSVYKFLIWRIIFKYYKKKFKKITN